MALRARPSVDCGHADALAVCYHAHMADSSQTPDRRHWPVRRFTLGTEPGDDLSAKTTPEQRLEMMWSLAVDAWTLASAALPRYTRRETPVRVVRPAADTRASGT